MIDGVGDVSIPELSYKTPLQAANLPTLDSLARMGVNGLMDPVEPGLACGSDTAHLSILGYDPRSYYRGRGAFECMGAGLDMIAGDIAFKSNFATWDPETNVVVHRRADRDVESLGPALCAAIDGVQLKSFPDHRVSVKYATEHRCGVRVRGPRLSDSITGTDPLKDGRPLVSCLPTIGSESNQDAIMTSNLVNELHVAFHEVLRSHEINRQRSLEGKNSANCVLLRGAGIRLDVPQFLEQHRCRGFVIAPTCIIAGLGASVGLDIVDAAGATGDYHTNLMAKADAAVAAFLDDSKNYNFGLIHVKAVDDAGHDFRIDLKVKFLEKIDDMIGHLRRRLCTALPDAAMSFVVTGDHSTPVRSGDHSYEPVPFVFAKVCGATAMEPDTVTAFDEISAASGVLGRFTGSSVMPLSRQHMVQQIGGVLRRESGGVL